MDNLKQDWKDINKMVRRHRARPLDHPSPGVRKVYEIYLMILEDAVKTLNSLIRFLK